MVDSPGGEAPSSKRRVVKKRSARRSRGVTWLLVGVTLFVLLVFASASAFLYLVLSQGNTVDVAEGSYVRVKLAGPITDAPMPGGLFQEPADFPLTATDIASVIRHAADDDRIAGIYLELENPMLGWGLAREIRTALVDFRASEKPCVAYGQMYMTKDYYIASACDKVLMAPAGVAYVAGIESTVMYYRDALESIGVEPQFIHVGDYKTAVEPFERNGPSDAAIEANEALLDSLYEQILSEIAASRGVEAGEIKESINALHMTPGGVVGSGLVDGLAYPDALKKTIDKMDEAGWVESLVKVAEPRNEEELPKFIGAKSYRQETNTWTAESDGTIAVVFAEGVILSGRGDDGLFGAAGLFDGPYRSWMKSARDNDAVKAVVVRVNSPGGSALASDFMWREVALTQAIGKPVVISMGDYAASGGYMMSCNADWIVAQPTTITGSIGVFGQFFSLEGTYEKLGLTEHTFKRGAHADLLAQMDRFEDEEKEILQAFVQDTYNDFVGQVAEGRNRTLEEVEPVAQGRVWTGNQAHRESHQLVDELGGLDEAIAKAAELASLESFNRIHIPEQKGFVDRLFDEMTQSQVQVQVSLPIELPVAQELIHEINVLNNIDRNGGVGAYLPGHF